MSQVGLSSICESIAVSRPSRTYLVVTIADEPGPARTEVVGGLLVELGLEGIEGAPSVVDEVG